MLDDYLVSRMIGKVTYGLKGGLRNPSRDSDHGA